MSNHRFFMFEPALAEPRIEWAANDTAPRLVRFARFAHDLLGWFEQQPALESVSLSCVVIPEFEKDPTSVRIRHHFKLTATGGVIPLAAEYASNRLPWHLTGPGVFQVSRSDELVKRCAMVATDDFAGYYELIHALARRVDTAFENFYVTHDLG